MGSWSPPGERVHNVCALGATWTEAREPAYAAIARIDWPEGFHRSDIGARAARALQGSDADLD